MRIVYCIPHLFKSGGMERVLTQKLNWLARHTDWQLSVVTTEILPEGLPVSHFPLDSRVAVYPLDIDFDADFRLPLWKKWLHHTRKMSLYKARLTAFLQEQHTDLCISLCGKEISFLHSLPCATLAEIHFSKNQRQLLIEAYHSGRIWHFLGLLRNRALVRDMKKVPRFVCLTEKDLQDWQSVGCTNAICIPNPCTFDAGEAKSSADSNAETLDKNTDEIGCANRLQEVIAVGRLHPQKGFDRLIAAWQQVVARHPDWQLRIIGEGDERVSLEKQISDADLSDSITLPGISADIRSDYSHAAFMVLSSRYEGLPLVMIESMWCATPCVAFDCPHGPAELLEGSALHTENADNRCANAQMRECANGILVPEGDVDALAAAICQMIEKPSLRRQLAAASFRYAHDRFSEQTIMQQWVTLFRQSIQSQACK